MKIMALMVGALAYSLFSHDALAAEAKLVTVETPRGASQPFLFAAPDEPKAGVILFVGGDGSLGISDSGVVTKNGTTFLARTYEDFVNDVVNYKFQKNVKSLLSKIHPVAGAEIRTMILLEGDAKSLNLPAVAEEPKTEEAVEEPAAAA